MTSTDKLIDFTTSKLQQLIDAAEKALPVATKYVLQITSLNCSFDILTGVSLLVGTGVAGYLSTRWFKSAREIIKEKGQSYFDNEEIKYEFGWVFAGLTALGLGIAAISYLTSFWDYVCIFRPDLYLIHLAIQKVLS